MTHPPSRLYLSDLRRSVLYKFRTSAIFAALPRCNASYPLPVRQASALPLASFRFAITRDILAVRLTLPLVGRVEDLHLQVGAPCRAHQKKRGTLGRPAYTNAFTTALLETIHAGNADRIHRVTCGRLVCRQQRRACH